MKRGPEKYIKARDMTEPWVNVIQEGSYFS